jgi:hypothetical protein
MEKVIAYSVEELLKVVPEIEERLSEVEKRLGIRQEETSSSISS